MGTYVNAFSHTLGGGQGVTLGPDGTQNYVEVVIQSSQVGSALTEYPVYVDLATLPAAFFSGVQTDGGDIRVTESDGSTRAPVDLVSIDTGGSAGELHFLASSVSASSNTTYRVYYNADSTLSQPAVGDTYGRNAVWNDYQLVWHLHEDPSGSAPQITDATGNGHAGSSAGSMTSGDLVTGRLGNAVQFDGSDDHIETSDDAALTLGGDFTISLWHKIDSLSGVDFLASAMSDSGVDGWYFVTSDSTGNWAAAISNGSTTYNIATSNGFTANDAAWHLASMRRDGSTLIIKQDQLANVTLAATSATIDPATGPRVSGRDADGGNIAATLDEFRLRKSKLSDDWLDAEHTNQDAPGTFYTVGTEQAA